MKMKYFINQEMYNSPLKKKKKKEEEHKYLSNLLNLC